MDNFEENFKRVTEELENLNKKYVIKGIPKGHGHIWTPKNEVRLWSVPKQTARLLKFLVLATKSKNILELGTSAGYSTLWLAWGAKINKGKVHTIELFEPKIELAKKYFKKAKLDNYITQIHGEIGNVLNNWSKNDLDFVFMDADKQNYLRYLKKFLPYLKKGGFIVADNAIDFGYLMKDFLKFVKTNENLESCLLNMDNGLLLIMKK